MVKSELLAGISVILALSIPHPIMTDTKVVAMAVVAEEVDDLGAVVGETVEGDGLDGVVARIKI